MDFLPTGIGGRATAALSAALLGRNAITQGERVRRVLEAAAGPITATDVAPRLEPDVGARRKTRIGSTTVELHDNSTRNAGRSVGARAASGPSRTPHNPDDHRRTSDGRWSRYERQLDAVDPTECAGSRVLAEPKAVSEVCVQLWRLVHDETEENRMERLRRMQRR